MSVANKGAALSPSKRSIIPPLENGDHLSASEFMRRFDAMPSLKKAELIQGKVIMSSPVRTDVHARPDSVLQTWLGVYAATFADTVDAVINATVKLGPDDVAQPDGALYLLQGQASLDEKGYLIGSPELVVEIAASSASIDAREKLASYRRAGIKEYLLWRVLDETLEWFVLDDDEYVPLEDSDGVIKSRTFDGLWLDGYAALAGDRAAVLSCLQRGLDESK